MEAHKMDERSLGNRLLDQVEDVVGLTYSDVDPQHPEQVLVLGIIDAGDGSRDVKLLAGNLADYEVVLVFSRYRDSAKDLVDLRDAVGVALDEQHLVPFRQEMLGKVVTDFTAASDDDVHD